MTSDGNATISVCGRHVPVRQTGGARQKSESRCVWRSCTYGRCARWYAFAEIASVVPGWGTMNSPSCVSVGRGPANVVREVGVRREAKQQARRLRRLLWRRDIVREAPNGERVDRRSVRLSQRMLDRGVFHADWRFLVLFSARLFWNSGTDVWGERREMSGAGTSTTHKQSMRKHTVIDAPDEEAGEGGTCARGRWPVRRTAAG